MKETCHEFLHYCDRRWLVGNLSRWVLCVALCCDPILGNHYSPGVSSRASQAWGHAPTIDSESPADLLTLSSLGQPGVARSSPCTLTGARRQGASALQPPRATLWFLSFCFLKHLIFLISKSPDRHTKTNATIHWWEWKCGTFRVFGGVLDAEKQDHNSAENKFENFDLGENRKKTLG